jgi:hypothetical protein
VPMELPVYRTVLGPEVELVGANDHLLSELHELISMAERGTLDLTPARVQTVPLDADPVNAVLDALDEYRAPFRTAIVP